MAIPLLVKGGTKLYKHLKEEQIPALDSFGNKVSDSTSKAVLGYKKLNYEATTELNELLWSGTTITKKISNDLSGKFAEMARKISSSMKKEFDQSYSHMNTFFQNSKALTGKEEQAILNKIKGKQIEREKSLQHMQNRLKAITNRAAKEKRDITEGEQREINHILNRMMNMAVQTMSKGEVEEKAIMERLKNASGSITARQAAETIRNSLKSKNAAIKDAVTKRDKVIAAAIRERDETGSISAKEAAKIIREANRQHDHAVKKAKSMHKNVVKEAKEQAGSHGRYIDEETGKVKTGWNLMWEKVFEIMGKIKSMFGFKSNTTALKAAKKTKSEEARYATGTSSTGHPGGPAIVGEKGRELAHIPGTGVTMLGARGP
ncbi:hypothetical protein D0466_18460 [Peribacillus glennii]|uniref:Phage tail tape measure protein n=2 Tax=Peribacillus glennii TaxID=2303991 RepID=A0A372L8I3_9BACI|nr:hypothetical protein D0466_18460 [Peribacillus glennii]